MLFVVLEGVLCLISCGQLFRIRLKVVNWRLDNTLFKRLKVQNSMAHTSGLAGIKDSDKFI